MARKRGAHLTAEARVALRAGLLTALGALAALTAASAEGDPRNSQTVEREIEHAGVDRHYRVWIPPGDPPSDGWPLLLAFHGGGGNAAQFESASGLEPVARREGFVVVYPAGNGLFSHRLLTWNAGDACCGRAARTGADDVGFALAVIEDVSTRVPIDRRRIYATGHSNGAMMAYRLAAEGSERIAAIAAVAGAARVSGLDAKRPVPVLHIHSVDDTRALYAGGPGPPFPITRARIDHHGVEMELARWQSRNGCANQATEIERRGTPNGHSAVHLSWSPCTSGATVEMWKLTGAGHGWPGGPSALPESVVGPDTDVIDASEEVWRFVSRFRRPAESTTAPNRDEDGQESLE